MENNAREEFEKYLKKYAWDGQRYKNGIDVGCGTARIDDMIISIDQQPDHRYAHNQIVWDCKNLNIFADNTLDFIFSSHCLEDFENIPHVFSNWWKKLISGGYMLLLLPDMEKCNCQFCNGSSRYPTIEDYKANGEGNPSHKTNVGKRFISQMLETLRLNYEIVQSDTIPHNEGCSIDFAILKK